MKACKDCRHFRYTLADRLSHFNASIGARCMAAETEYDKVTGETFTVRRRCWEMRLFGKPCGPEGKLWGPI